MSLQFSIHNLSQIPNIKPTSGDESGTVVPKIKQNVDYKVSVTIFDISLKQVVLIRETKLDHHNKLCLPSGKVEPNENLIEAAKRETLEEAGVDVEIKTLFSIEEDGVKWLRFNFIGILTSEDCKLKNFPDKESLCAEWYSIDRIEKLNNSLKQGATLSPEMKSFKESFRRLDTIATIGEAQIAMQAMIKKNFLITIPDINHECLNSSVRLIITSKLDNESYTKVEKGFD